MAIQFVNLSAEQRAMVIGKELLGRINMQAAVNASQMERINSWLLASKSAYSSLQEQVQVGKDSLNVLAKELEAIKEEQRRSREESAASRKNNAKIKDSFDTLQDKLKKDLEGRLSGKRLKKMMKLLHKTGTHIRSAASTVPAPNPDDEVGDAPQDESSVGQEPPLSAASEHPDVDQRSGTGDVGNGGDGSDGGASRVRVATSPSSSDSSGSSDSESDGGKGNKGRKGGEDKKKEDEQVDKVFWLGDLHAHLREKKKSWKLQMNRPQTFDGDRSSKPTYRQWCSGLERYLDYHRGEWEKDADLINMVGSYMKDKALDWFDSHALHFKAIKVKDTFKAFVEAMDTRFKNDKEAQLALEKMKVKYAGDILSYIDNIELLNMKVGSHGLQYRDLIKAGLNTELRDRLSQTQGGEPDEDDALVQAIKERGLACERHLEEKKREDKNSGSAPSSGKNLKRKRGGAGTAAPATGTSDPPAKKQSTGDKSAGTGNGNPPRFTKEQMEEALKGVQQTLCDARDRKKLCRRCGIAGHRWQL